MPSTYTTTTSWFDSTIENKPYEKIEKITPHPNFKSLFYSEFFQNKTKVHSSSKGTDKCLMSYLQYIVFAYFMNDKTCTNVYIEIVFLRF